MALAVFRPCGIDFERTGQRTVFVKAPFRDVAVHIINTPSIRLETFHGAGTYPAFTNPWCVPAKLIKVLALFNLYSSVEVGRAA